MLGGAQSRGIRIALEAGCAVVIGALLWQAASRGRVDAAELARDGTADPVLLLAPGAVALACGLIALRVVPALLRALARFAGRPPTRLRRAPTRVRRARSIGAYLTLVFLARAPGRTAAAVAVVAVAAAAATFALGHARALQRGELDQAAYRTAGDVRTLAAVPGAPDARGTPVIRAQAETLATSTPVQLLGVGAEALPRLPGWRADFSPVPLSTLARRLDGDPGGVRMRGIEIPRTAISARRLFVVHHGATGNVVSLQGASLEVAEGEMVAVMGPSGSGKSTLLACLSGLQAVTAGELHVFGARLDAASARALAKHRARTVAVVSQDAGRALGDDQPVGARIALRARLAGMGSRNAKHRAAELLERVGLEGREGAPNRAQRRRAAAGRAVRRDRGAAEAAAG